MKLLKTTVIFLLTATISQIAYAFSKVPTVTADTCPAEDKYSSKSKVVFYPNIF